METRNEDGKNEANDIDENEEDDVLVLKKKHLYTEADENEDDDGLLVKYLSASSFLFVFVLQI